MKEPKRAKRAATVLCAGILFNLSIGVLYAWSVLKTKLTAPSSAGGWGWGSTQAGLPYTFAVLFFALGLLAGGRMQDKAGPARVAMVGGALTGLGLILAGLAGNSVPALVLCYGVICGSGIGFGYGCVTPAALKWFHPGQKGLVSGLTVGGFSLAAVYLAPLMNALLNRFGIQKSLLLLGIAVMIIACPLARQIQNPPPGYLPPPPRKAKRAAARGKRAGNFTAADYTWQEMIKTKRFYLLFIMFLLPSSVGLMIIGNISKIAHMQAGVTDTAILALLVSFMAVTNSFGRVLGGLISDKIGRVNALFAVFALQALNMAGFMFYRSLAALICGICAAGFSYGTLISVFPSITADQYGLKNYGANYGILFLAWGLAGVVAPLTADIIFDANGNFYAAYLMAALMMAAMIFVNVLLKAELAALKNKP